MFRQHRSSLLSISSSLILITISGIVSTSTLLIADGIIISKFICITDETHGSKCELQTKENCPAVTKKGEAWYCSNYHIPGICSGTTKISDKCEIKDPIEGQCGVKIDCHDGSVLKDTAGNDVRCAGSPAQCATI